MKLSLNWLREFVDLEGISPEQIRDELSLKTAEVEGFEIKGAGIVGVVVGEILEAKPHPTSRKPLTLLKVKWSGGVSAVVCGAPNCRVGMKVAFAPVGARLGDFEIKVASLAGEESHGMCLSARELGIGPDHDGILDLTETGVLPQIADVIFEIDNKSVTNRPDLWGHYGVARELSVIFGRKLKALPVADLSKFDDLPSVPVKIESPDDCYSFGAFKVENITARHAPQDMQTRLYYCGINPHGFLVDLSNYIMLELGQPNHAFDARKVGSMSAGSVSGGKFMTLKDQEIEVKPEYLFIKSDGKPVSLAGIMGGQSSMIDEQTDCVVFEFATFNPWTIRKTSQELGIRSDSSARYEKSLDTNLNKIGAARAVKLLNQIDKGARVASSFNWQVARPTTEKTIELSKKYLERFAGIGFNNAELKRNLKGLGFAPVIKGDVISVTVPTWRATKDINLPVDIIEEIVRMHGFNNIQACPPKVALVPVERMPRKRVVDEVKDLLVGKFGLSEVHTYIFGKGSGELQVSNSIAGGKPNIRDGMADSMIEAVKKNSGQEVVRIFEVGEVWRAGKSQKVLGMALAARNTSAEELYLELSRIVRDLLPGVKFELGKATKSIFHPKNNAKFKNGCVGIVRGENMAVSCIAVESLLRIKDTVTQTTRVSRFPKTTLDFTVTHDGVYGELENVLEKFKHNLVTGFRLKDIYGNKYTLEFGVVSFDKTLTTEEIQAVHKAIVDYMLKAKLSVDL